MSKNIWKINTDGTYRPFFGYTVIAMCKGNQGMENIEKFIENSELLSKYYAVLPVESYHVTLFDIGVIHEHYQPIPAIQRWLDEGNRLPDADWLPGDILNTELIQARQACKKQVNNEFTVNCLNVLFKDNSILLQVEVPDKEFLKKVEELRQECSDLFEKDDGDRKYHVTFAYKYNLEEVPDEETENLTMELSKLGDLITTEIGNTIALCGGDVYWFRSMEHFMTFEEFTKFSSESSAVLNVATSK